MPELWATGRCGVAAVTEEVTEDARSRAGATATAQEAHQVVQDAAVVGSQRLGKCRGAVFGLSIAGHGSHQHGQSRLNRRQGFRATGAQGGSDLVERISSELIHQ
ncbi:MAG: hypothetical protein U0002_04660 [Thermoanaerobaculia bacterium]